MTQPKDGWLLWFDKLRKHGSVLADLETNRLFYENAYGVNLRPLSVYPTPAGVPGQPPQDGFGGMWKRHPADSQPTTFKDDKPADYLVFDENTDISVEQMDFVVEVVMKKCSRCGSLCNPQLITEVQYYDRPIPGAECPMCWYPKTKPKFECRHFELAMIRHGEHAGQLRCLAPDCDARFDFGFKFGQSTIRDWAGALKVVRAPTETMRNEFRFQAPADGTKFLIAGFFKGGLYTTGSYMLVKWVYPANLEAYPPPEGWGWKKRSKTKAQPKLEPSKAITPLQGDGERRLNFCHAIPSHTQSGHQIFYVPKQPIAETFVEAMQLRRIPRPSTFLVTCSCTRQVCLIAEPHCSYACATCGTEFTVLSYRGDPERLYVVARRECSGAVQHPDSYSVELR